MSLRGTAELIGSWMDEYASALREMAGIDCGSFTPEGVNRIADLCEARFRSDGWSVGRHPHSPEPGEAQLGDTVVGRLAGPGGPRLLLIGHMDTVFEDGTAEARPFAVEGGTARGPGVADMKGGLLSGFFAVRALGQAGVDGWGSVTYVCNPDEEVGSPFSRRIIGPEAERADVCFVLESARENGNIVSARKGIADIRIEIAGRAAHAGVEPERGASAILEAAHKIVALHGLNGRWPGVTVNVGVAQGGTRPNVVPDRCVLEVDLRSPHEATFAEAEEEVRWIAADCSVRGTSATVHSGPGHRPMEKSEAGGRLAALAVEIASELGFSTRDQATGGASDANITASLGVPTLDGLGPVGGGAHGPDEWLDLDSVAPRTALLAGLISRARTAV